jgi:hypothetical protein
MIDFSKMFDAQGNALVPSAPEQAVAETGEEAPTTFSMPVERARDPATGQCIAKTPAVDLGFDRQGNVIPSTNEHGLPAEIAKEMHQSADGFVEHFEFASW